MTTGARQALGKAIKRWFASNSWSQQCPHEWAKQTESAGGPWNSQLSLLMNARLEPKPQFFCSLAAFNAAIASKDLKGVTDRALFDKLQAGSPMVDNDGKVVDAVGFFGMFIGEIPIPDAYAVETRTFTDADAAQATVDLRDRFRAYAQAEMLSPAEAWQHVAANIKLTSKQQARLKEVLSGWAELTVEELSEGLPVVVGSVFSGT